MNSSGEDPDLVNLNPRKMYVLIAVVLTLWIWSMFSSSQKTSKSELLKDEKIKVCKAYIGQLFSKPTSIINNYRYEDDQVFVFYIRKVDQTVWRYACKFDGHSVVWAGWWDDTNEWGRWRTEDQVPLSIDKTTNTIRFVMNRTGETVTVK
jgi:hypothetical protein